jgi:hypothetical protein
VEQRDFYRFDQERFKPQIVAEIGVAVISDVKKWCPKIALCHLPWKYRSKK